MATSSPSRTSYPIMELHGMQVLDLVLDHEHPGVEEPVHDRRAGQQEVDPRLLQVVDEGGVVDVRLGIHVTPAHRTDVAVHHRAIQSAAADPTGSGPDAVSKVRP